MLCKAAEISKNRRKHIIPSGILYPVRNAGKRGIEVSITDDELYQIFLNQNGKCALSSVDISLTLSRTKNKTAEITASPDRIDSSKGYHVGNVQWIHKDINFMKSNMPEDEFIHWCELIYLNKKANQ